MAPPFQIIHLPIIDSTSTYLKSMTMAAEFTCITADEQTAGRGRQSNRWHSARGEGLCLSVLLRPPAAATGISLISLLAAVATAEALGDVGRERLTGIDIKWPNDVLIGERKIAGILVETVGYGVEERLRVIVGIGVNLHQTSFPAPLAETATSFKIETGSQIEVTAFRDRLLERLAHWYGRWVDGQMAAIVRRWSELSSYALGKEVMVTLDSGRLTGRTAGIDEDGSLLLLTESGQLRRILAGEVARLRVGEGQR